MNRIYLFPLGGLELAEQEKGLMNPILSSVVTCPICENEEVYFYTLKAKSLASRPNVFSIPIYVDTPKYALVDFNDYSFSVCPHCYFTSIKKQEFVYFDSVSGTKNKSVILPKLAQYWTENEKEIHDLLVDNFVDANSYREPRTDEGIISSCKLAIYRSGVEIKLRVPYSYLRRARYYLKYFYFFRKLYKKDNEEILKLALADFEVVFKESDFPELAIEYEVLYIIIALFIRLGDDSNATSYLKVMDQTKAEVTQKSKADPRISTTEIIRWLTRAKNLWQEKGDLNVWEVLKPWPLK